MVQMASNENSMAAANSFDISESVEVVFHDIPYFMTVSAYNGDTLHVEVEQKTDASIWKGDFSSKYIEDITAKTGNYKKFTVFVKMLLSAVKQQSESVFVDLLTYQDLEQLKVKKSGGQPPSARTLPPNNKRYLILTYAAEFDRVHYPLPLMYDEAPDPEHLKRTISRLRTEIEQLQAGSSSMRNGDTFSETRRLREENNALKQQIKQLERGDPESRELTKEYRTVLKHRDLLQTRLETIEAELERERSSYRRETRKKAKEAQEAVEELERAKEIIRELRRKIQELTDELNQLRKRGAPPERAEKLRSAYGYYGNSRGSSRPSSSNSRNSSRGPSPGKAGLYGGSGAERSYSRGRENSSRERGRPYSAPERPRRFDPTEYIKQKQDKLKRAAEQRPGTRTPPRSGASSVRGGTAGSRPNSRPSSTERERSGLPYLNTNTRRDGLPYSNGSSRQPSRSSSVERDRERQQRLGLVRSQPNSRPSSSERSGKMRDSPILGRPRAQGWGGEPPGGAGSGGWSKFPQGASASIGQSGERSMSPGRALLEVKKKLSEYVHRRSSQDGPSEPGSRPDTAGSTQPTHPIRPDLFDDTSADIADIDSRLHALQSFLRMAKTASGTTSAAASNG